MKANSCVRHRTHTQLVRRFSTLCVALAVTVVSQRAGAATLQPGDLVFSQDGAGSGVHNAIVKADPVTGNRTLISQTGVLGSGPDFGSLIGGLALDHSGNILLTGFDAGAVFKINPVTGDRSILSSDAVGTGPTIHNLNDLIIAPSGDVYVTAQDIQSVVRIDPLTGNRTVVSGPGLGAGPVFITPVGLTRTSNGDFYVYDADNETATFVDHLTGNRTIVSGGGVGSGPPFGAFGTDIALLAGGFLATTQLSEIERVNIATGARSQLSGPLAGSGPALQFINYLNVGPDGSLIASGTEAIYRIDPITGNRTILTGDSFGTGPTVGLYREAVVVPEPASLAIAAVGAVVLVGSRFRSRVCRARLTTLTGKSLASSSASPPAAG